MLCSLICILFGSSNKRSVGRAMAMLVCVQAGSYCPDPLTSLTCPEGHFCPMQSMTPLPCSWVSHCPAGSSLPQITWGTYIGIWVLVLALLLLWWSGMSWLQRRRVQRLQKCRQEVAARRLSGLKDKQAAGCELARYSSLLCAITVRPRYNVSLIHSHLAHDSTAAQQIRCSASLTMEAVSKKQPCC